MTARVALTIPHRERLTRRRRRKKKDEEQEENELQLSRYRVAWRLLVNEIILCSRFREPRENLDTETWFFAVRSSARFYLVGNGNQRFFPHCSSTASFLSYTLSSHRRRTGNTERVCLSKSTWTAPFKRLGIIYLLSLLRQLRIRLHTHIGTHTHSEILQLSEGWRWNGALLAPI